MENEMNQEVVTAPLTLEELKEKILDKNTVLTSLMRSSIEAAWELGGYLIMAKSLVPHGTWGAWIKKNLPIASSSSTIYMRLRERHPTVETALTFSTIDDAALGYDKSANTRVIQESVTRQAKEILEKQGQAQITEMLQVGEQTQYDAMRRLGLLPLTERTLDAIKGVLLEEYGEEALSAIGDLESLFI